MREREIEHELIRRIKAVGGLAPKWVSPGLDGVPDRIVLMPGGRIAFAELKAPGKKPRPLQVKRKRQLESLGFRVYVIDSPDVISGILNEITEDRPDPRESRKQHYKSRLVPNLAQAGKEVTDNAV